MASGQVPRGTSFMTRIIAVSNQKGGVGKTTSVINLAAFCALAGRKTLVVDNDPQANASSVLAPEITSGSIYRGMKPVAVDGEPGLWVIPSSASLIDDERELTRQPQGRYALSAALEPYRGQFDLIFLDCPPNLTLLPTNALLAADDLLLPLPCEYFAMEGLGQLLAYVEDLRITAGSKIQLAGILLTLFDRDNPRSFAVDADLREHFGERVFSTRIPRDRRLAAAPSHARSILTYDPLSPGSIAYASATKEFLRVLNR